MFPCGEGESRVKFWCKRRKGMTLHCWLECVHAVGTTMQVGWNSQPTRMVILENCPVPAAHLLGKEGQVTPNTVLFFKEVNGGSCRVFTLPCKG